MAMHRRPALVVLPEASECLLADVCLGVDEKMRVVLQLEILPQISNWSVSMNTAEPRVTSDPVK